ncbi:hypothetical protein N801_19025 [Knoellia aerolata DSM 18566]|uniref:OmpA-like domain-containing protein n=1 Tax=Knoellia aerolata DSM 18566 TaxID=1385519 RepID=A0A0A0JVV8_9MICO|nr:hypothetical protein [Knoellia aerolata]KGN39771.1 hypothetical protein N801_19025 [Knoellia aerolata DSM 18566]
MRQDWSFAVIDGFASGEVDFAARLAAEQHFRQMVDEFILGPLVNASSAGAVLRIEGHSDRVDTGEDHPTSLALERDASRSRAESAASSLLTLLGQDWLVPSPTAWGDLPYVAVETLFFGATKLSVEPVDEGDRRGNRRVELYLCRFVPDQ